MATNAFTGHALTTEKVWCLYDTKAGRFVEGRSWDDLEVAGRFVGSLTPLLAERFVVMIRETYVLAEYRDGERF